MEIVLGLPWDFPLILSYAKEFPKKIWLILKVILDQNMIRKDQKSQEIRVATDHLELIPWTCSLVAKLTPKEIKAAHATWHRLQGNKPT